MIFISLFCIWLGLRVNAARQQRWAVQFDEFSYDFEFDPRGRATSSPHQSRVPRWILDRTGKDLFHNVVLINMNYWNDASTLSNTEVAEDTRLRLRSLPHLKELNLQLSQAGDECMTVVGEAPFIESLWCGVHPGITDSGASHLKSLRRLKNITLYECRLTDDALRVFGSMPQLESLDLDGACFTDAGLAHLRNLKGLRRLLLRADDMHITDAGLMHLEQLPRLAEVYLLKANITPAGKARLKRALPAIDFTYFSPELDGPKCE
jgi:hypothetical protein